MVVYLHCRLCAFLKCRRALVNLDANEMRRKTVLAQLSHLNICVNNLDSDHDHLPKRICTLCINSLEKAYNFVLSVQKGQEVLKLNDIARNFRTEHDYSQSFREVTELPSIVEKNGGILILSPSSIQAIVERNSKIIGINNSPTLKRDAFGDKIVIEDILDRYKNDTSTSHLPTTEGSTNECEIDTKLSTDKIDVETNADVNGFEEHKITVTDYQITKSKPDVALDNSVGLSLATTEGSLATTEGSVIKELQIDTKSTDTINEVNSEEIPGICFDFEEENVDENSEIDDNFEVLRKTNVTCNANEVENSEELMDFQEEIEQESQLFNDTIQTEIDPISESYKEKAVEIATKIDSENSKGSNENSCENHEQKMHTDDFIKEEMLSDDEIPEELPKQNIFNDCTRTPVVVLNRISDADIVALSMTETLDNVKCRSGLISKSNESQDIIRNFTRKNETESNLLHISEYKSWKRYRWK